MTELTAAGFPGFFRALWGYDPFAWQAALAERVLGDGGPPWPQAIALPTAAGKTACLDVAIYALAASAAMGSARQPRRIFFAVDRRVIVDAAYDRACQISTKLQQANDGIVAQVARQLRALAGSDDAPPLAAHLLRGGIYRAEAWAHSPLQPMVVASTVDQLGSRLLFRGYGRSALAWPILAGLTGNDALVLLDEAHCAQPFMETLHSVARYRTWAADALPTPFQVAILSATPPPALGDVFRDTSGEAADPAHPLGRRVLAGKPARLIEAAKAKGRAGTVALADKLAEMARDLTGDAPRAVVVFCNRVATARAVAAKLRDRHVEDVVLLTGRMRELDRDDLVSTRLQALASGHSSDRRLDRPLFVVATQTLEVGADVDFDVLVTECASLDALRQRFGRLNRMGRDIPAPAAVVVRADQTDGSEDDPVYGSALAATWQWLRQQAADGDVVDFGVAALARRLPQGEALARLCAPADHAPVLLPAHVDILGQTAPVPAPSPDVALYLHGPARPEADVLVCFRADVDPGKVDESLETLNACPPLAAECVAVPIGLMRRWLEGTLSDDVGADVQGTSGGDTAKSDAAARARDAIRWRGPDDAEVVSGAQALRPGDVLVLPAHAPDHARLCDFGADGHPWFDLGDRARAHTRRQAALRLHPQVLGDWPDSAAKANLLRLAQAAHDDWDADPDAVQHEAIDALRAAAADDSVPAWAREVAGHLASAKARANVRLHPLGGLIVDSRRRMPMPGGMATGAVALPFADETDATASGTVRVPLREHLPGVADFATRFASGCGLPDALVHALACAGRLHDLGKADPRFQALLRGGTPWLVDEPLAKSDRLPAGRKAFQDTCQRAGYPRGGRHELLSVRMAASTPEALPADPMLRDLVLHLVASHHGHCRPFAPVVEDREAVEVTFALDGHTFAANSRTGLERLDSGVPERYWRLVRHFGWWGLAWLEAILRLADHRRSEWEQEQAHD
ncbi:MAG: type I-G CRISPR-associated helicase/endonuclease Cas3g [Pseudomonadota bacterium]